MIDNLPRPTRVLTSFVSGEGAIDPHLTQEWLLTNGLGGYASGTVLGPITRRYHGLLIAATPLPTGRFMTLHGLSERFRVQGHDVLFAGPRDLIGGSDTAMLKPAAFHLECGLPVWVYDILGSRIERRILLPYRQNTVYIEYRYVEGRGSIRLGLRPGVQFRNHDANVNAEKAAGYTVEMKDRRIQIDGGPELPALRLMTNPNAAFTYDPKAVEIDYEFEKHRGYPWKGSLWSPGYFRADLEPGSSLILKGSTEPWDVVEGFEYKEALATDAARRKSLIECAHPDGARGKTAGPGTVGDAVVAELALAADQFVMTPVTRREDVARARATGDEARSVIAGYHWFTDWGRDTMISLEGLSLVTGRHKEAGWILRMFAQYVRDGLIPNLFPEGEKQGLYHTADASLWFFHALAKYLEISDDRATLRFILPKLREIADAHIAGTRFGIHVDPSDGLLAQGQEGYQLTWMDAKVGDWVVTPRRGKAVEIDALWYNALCLLTQWISEEDENQGTETYRDHAARARESFNRKFWNPEKNYLFDVVEGESGGGKPGNDPSCRPNQIFAIALPHPVLDRKYWQPVVDAVTKHLLTPVGLRSLAPGEPEYKQRYDGDLRSRDAAYHQGSVWAWLIGPYIDALEKVYPERCGLDLLKGFDGQLDLACVGSISEIFDAEAPHTPRGCIAQAWSVAEVLRSRIKLSGRGQERHGEPFKEAVK